MLKRRRHQLPPPSSPAASRSFFKDADAVAKYACVETEPPVNLYLFLNAIYGGITVTCNDEVGTATISGLNLSFVFPLSFCTGRCGQLTRASAVELALAACRIHGPQGFCYAWTRRTEPIFREVVATMRTAMGHFPWQFDVAWRVGRADLYDAVGVRLFQLASEMPEAYRLITLADRLFSAPWTMSATVGGTVGALAREWGILAVPCNDADARLVVAGVPLFVAQRDWALLALNLLFMPDIAAQIPEVERARRMFSR